MNKPTPVRPDRHRRLLLAGVGATLLTACSARPEAPTGPLAAMFRLMREQPDTYPAGTDAILANPAAQLGVRVSGHAPGVFELVGQGTDDTQEHQWLTGGPVLMVTRFGRIYATRGFVPDLGSLQYLGRDPLARACRGTAEQRAYRSTRYALRVSDEGERRFEQDAVLQPDGESDVELLGQRYRCELWRESVVTLPSGERHENLFYIHKASGHVLKSLQKPFHTSPLIRTELLKAPGAGPR